MDGDIAKQISRTEGDKYGWPQTRIRMKNRSVLSIPQYATTLHPAAKLLLERLAVERVKRSSFDWDGCVLHDEQSDDIATIDEALSDFDIAMIDFRK